MLQPKKTKFRKQFRRRGQASGVSVRGANVSFGEVGLKATTAGEISARQIEAARRVITRSAKRSGKVWIRIFPDKVLTAKGAEVPMGSGKGSPDKWVMQVKPGRILFEMAGVAPEIMNAALKAAAYKLPVKCKVVANEI